jgi:hypothetical protein
MTVKRIRWSGLVIVATCAALRAACCPAADPGGKASESIQPPFYPDKMNLGIWLDAQGQSHPIHDPQDWQRRREHILANMQLVMGPLPTDDQGSTKFASRTSRE